MIRSLAHNLALLFGLVSCLSCSAKTNFNVVGREMVLMLQNGHYAHLSFDDEMSKKIFYSYIETLDPNREYFTQNILKSLEEKYLTELDDLLIRSEGMAPAEEIFQVFLERLNLRFNYIKAELEKNDFDFTKKENVLRDRSEVNWPKEDEEAKILWKKRLKNTLLSEILRQESVERAAKEQGVENPDKKDYKTPQEKVLLRYERIQKSFVDADIEDVSGYFFGAVSNVYDPHTDYLSKRERESFNSGISNSLVGIGALLSAKEDGYTYINGIVNKGPADRQGDLQLNDKIVGVDSNSTGDMVDIMFMDLSKVVSKIRGEKNSNVTLKVEPAGGTPGESKLVKIKRERIEMKDQFASAKIYDFKDAVDGSSAKLAWLHIPSFYRDFSRNLTSVARDVEILIKRLNKENIDGLLIDMRGNGGGSLDDVQKITGLFTGAGPVVQVKDSFGSVKAKTSYQKEPLYTGPLAVLVDRASASASEILAAALQDYNRAVIIGHDSTYGKGTVQQPMEIGRFMKWFQDSSRAGMLKATIQKFYRVSGGSTQLKGVEPDIVLPSIYDSLEVGEKFQDYALPYDSIKPAPGFKPEDRELYLEELRQASSKRIKENREFIYTIEDIEIANERLKGNKISLNKQDRVEEIEKSEARKKERNKERLVRYRKIEEQDMSSFTAYDLTLDDIELEVLPKIDPEDQSRYMKLAENDYDKLDDTPDLPNGIDFTKREGLKVLVDLVKLSSTKKTAQIEQ